MEQKIVITQMDAILLLGEFCVYEDTMDNDTWLVLEKIKKQLDKK